MNNVRTLEIIPEVAEQKTPEEKEIPFKPTGAIAFFIALIILCLIIWYGVYFIMLQRS